MGKPLTEEQIYFIITKERGRWMRSEDFLRAYINLSWWTRLFFGKRIIQNHLDRIKQDYNGK
jgi:hypothetical protein